MLQTDTAVLFMFIYIDEQNEQVTIPSKSYGYTSFLSKLNVTRKTNKFYENGVSQCFVTQS